MNIHDKTFDKINQDLIDRYVDHMNDSDYMIEDDTFSENPDDYRMISAQWIGHKKYTEVRRQDILLYSKSDVKLTQIKKMNLINFNIIDMKFEKMMIEHGSIMNGMFKNTEFFRFCLRGDIYCYPGFNEYHECRNVVMNCKFINCVFMNSYTEYTDWINCEFINCTFINSKLCCADSEYKNCKFENNQTLNIRV